MTKPFATQTPPNRIWVDDDTWFSNPVTYPHAVEYLRADVVEARLSDPTAVHINMLRGTIAKPTVEQIIHLYGREAFQPMITAARQDAKEAEAYAEELEAKLAAAVEALICGRYFLAGEATREQFLKAYRTAMEQIKSGVATTPYGLEGESHD